MLYTIPETGTTLELSAVRVIHQRGSNKECTWFSIIMADLRQPLVIERHRPADMPDQLWMRVIEQMDASYQSLIAAKAAHGVDIDAEYKRFHDWWTGQGLEGVMTRGDAKHVWEAALQLTPPR